MANISSDVEDLIGPGIKRLANLKGCDVDTIEFVPCITYKDRHRELDLQLLTELANKDDYNELSEYINTTCKELKAESNGG
jgi:5-methylcytosine-specific restriction endonuclease McrBC GTP-binding regulatory subunit McrB